VRSYTRQCLEGLKYLHEKRVIHRDIKPANILIDDGGKIMLADFGASKAMKGMATVETEVHSIRGTPYFMAPEVIKQTNVGRKSDIWSLGGTILQMMTGEPPWKSMGLKDPAALMFKIASSGESPPIPEGTAENLRSFLSSCFQIEPKERARADELLTHAFILEEAPPG